MSYPTTGRAVLVGTQHPRSDFNKSIIMLLDLYTEHPEE